jgi:Flp pilus assembly protein TadB
MENWEMSRGGKRFEKCTRQSFMQVSYIIKIRSGTLSWLRKQVAFWKRGIMSHNDPQNVGADAQFIEAGGLKNWGCAAFLLSVLVLLLLFFIVKALLSSVIGPTAALWITLVLLIGVVAGIVFLWTRRRRRQREALRKLQHY